MENPYKPSNLLLPKGIKPHVTELWEIYEQAKTFSKGRAWHIACKLCGSRRVATTSLLNAGQIKCRCQIRTREMPTLVIEGVKKPLADWCKLTRQSVHAARKRYYKRLEKSYTDAQILYGVRSVDAAFLVTEEAVKAWEFENDKDAIRAATKMVLDQWYRSVRGVPDRLADVLAPIVEHYKHVVDTCVGWNFRLGIAGCTLGDIIKDMSSIEDVYAVLRAETFLDLGDKYKRLVNFSVEVNEAFPNSLSLGEQRQLLAPAIKEPIRAQET